MFGIGGSEILVILVIALLFLGPDKLPDAAKQISKGIRDLKKQSRVLQQTIENDEHIGGAIRDLKSALRGDEIAPRPPIKKIPKIENKILPPEPAAAEAAPPEATAARRTDRGRCREPGRDRRGAGDSPRPARSSCRPSRANPMPTAPISRAPWTRASSPP